MLGCALRSVGSGDTPLGGAGANTFVAESLRFDGGATNPTREGADHGGNVCPFAQGLWMKRRLNPQPCVPADSDQGGDEYPSVCS